MDMKPFKENGMTRCADDYTGDRCEHQVEEICDACRNGFCWEHLLNVEVTVGAAIGEERVMCRECAAREFIRLNEENAELKRDLRLLQARVAELEQQVKRSH
jgi:hypothetical protein